jgi:hypothetical protein
MLSTLCLSLAPAFGADPLLQEPAKPAAPTAQAAAKQAFSYTYAQVDIVRGDADGFSDGPDGFDLMGSYALRDNNLFVFGGISMLSGDVGNADVDYDTYGIGLGYHTPLNPITDLVFGGSLLLADTDTNADGGDWSVEAGVRHNASAQFEIDGTLGITDYSGASSNVWLEFGAIYVVSPQLGICATLLTSDDIDTISLGVRYNL